MLKIRGTGTLLFLVTLLPAPAVADSWPSPEVETIAAADGSARVVITPGPVYPPQPDDIDARLKLPRARVERWTGGTWVPLWDRPLRNEVAPVDVLVAPQGRYLVTLDEWHGMGIGENAVVIHDAHGDVIRAWPLSSLVAQELHEAMPRSVSSLWWRGEPRISLDGRRLVVPLAVPRMYSVARGRETGPVELQIDLASGQTLPAVGPEWSAYRATIGMAALLDRERARARDHWLDAPMLAPTGNSTRQWDDYLREAWLRTSPRWRELRPRVVVFAVQPADAREIGLRELRETIAFTGDVLMLGSPDPALLRAIAIDYFSSLRPGALPGLEVHVAIDAEGAEAIAQALAATGATLHRIDPAMPIPQRNGRFRAVDAARARRLRDL